MASVVIAAYNEAGVVGRCLRALRVDDGGLEVVVVPNGCTDSTADVARGFSAVRVVELELPGKAAALVAGDAVAVSHPRAYLDADVSVSRDDLERLFAALGGDVLAVAPRRVVETSGSPLLVRAYFAVHQRLPVMGTSLFGRGLVVLSRDGRARFDTFPEVMADDMFLDGLFGPGEKRVVDSVASVVQAPRRTGALYRRLVRVRRANAALRREVEAGAVSSGVGPARRTAFLGVAVRRPWLAPAVLWYGALTVAAEVGARRGDATDWGRDDSTRKDDRT